MKTYKHAVFLLLFPREIQGISVKKWKARHIMAVCGHRWENSIRSYSRTDLGIKRKIFDNLADFVYEQHFNKQNFSFGINFDEEKYPSQTVSASSTCIRGDFGHTSTVTNHNRVNTMNSDNNRGVTFQIVHLIFL